MSLVAKRPCSALGPCCCSRTLLQSMKHTHVHSPSPPLAPAQQVASHRAWHGHLLHVPAPCTGVQGVRRRLLNIKVRFICLRFSMLQYVCASRVWCLLAEPAVVRSLGVGKQGHPDQAPIFPGRGPRPRANVCACVEGGGARVYPLMSAVLNQHDVNAQQLWVQIMHRTNRRPAQLNIHKTHSASGILQEALCG